MSVHAANIDMKPSTWVDGCVKRFEGCMAKAYRHPGDDWTIGYGHTEGVHQGMEATSVEILWWLASDIANAWHQASHLIDVQLTQGQCDAITDFTFNVGVGRLQGSTLLRFLNAREMVAAGAQFELWVHADGKRLEGLVNRRRVERERYFA